jgi:uncharacterized membrane protein YhaH (DUF805 family)
VLSGLFSFKGRVDRRRYILFTLGSLVLPTGAVVLATVADRLLGGGPYAWPTKYAGLALPVLALVVFMWATLALATKRLRDIGLPPLLTMSGLMLLGVFGQIVGSQWLAPAIAALLMAAWSYGLPAFFALWPGRDRVSPAEVAETFA